MWPLFSAEVNFYQNIYLVCVIFYQNIYLVHVEYIEQYIIGCDSDWQLSRAVCDAA